MTTGLDRVLERVAPALRRRVLDGGLTPSSFATPLAVAALALEAPGLTVVTATAGEADALADALGAWLGPGAVALWPGWDTHPLERVSPDVEVMAQRSLIRERLARGERPAVLVCSVRAAAQVLAPSTPPVVTVPVGHEVGRDELLAQLVAAGYRREHQVEHRAEIAVRGGIVDVWPAQADEPVRLDFFGDVVERLTVFDVATQRSVRRQNAVGCTNVPSAAGHATCVRTIFSSFLDSSENRFHTALHQARPLL